MTASVPFTNFLSIKDVSIPFSNQLWNVSAWEFAHDCSKFFDQTDGAILDANFLAMLGAEAEKLLHLCKGEATHVPSLSSKMSHKSCSKAGDGTCQLCTQQNIKEIFEEAILESQTAPAAKIIVMCDAPHFHPTFDGNDLDLIFTNETKLLTGIAASLNQAFGVSAPAKTVHVSPPVQPKTVITASSAFPADPAGLLPAGSDGSLFRVPHVVDDDKDNNLRTPLWIHFMTHQIPHHSWSVLPWWFYLMVSMTHPIPHLP
jgi:hypothetical protein